MHTCSNTHQNFIKTRVCGSGLGHFKVSATHRRESSALHALTYTRRTYCVFPNTLQPAWCHITFECTGLVLFNQCPLEHACQHMLLYLCKGSCQIVELCGLLCWQIITQRSSKYPPLATYITALSVHACMPSLSTLTRDLAYISYTNLIFGLEYNIGNNPYDDFQLGTNNARLAGYE